MYREADLGKLWLVTFTNNQCVFSSEPFSKMQRVITVLLFLIISKRERCYFKTTISDLAKLKWYEHNSTFLVKISEKQKISYKKLKTLNNALIPPLKTYLFSHKH